PARGHRGGRQEGSAAGRPRDQDRQARDRRRQARAPGGQAGDSQGSSTARSRFGQEVASGAVFTQQRRASATLHACAMQPRGVNGGSASKISAIVPSPKSPRSAITPSRKRRAPTR